MIFIDFTNIVDLSMLSSLIKKGDDYGIRSNWTTLGAQRWRYAGSTGDRRADVGGNAFATGSCAANADPR
jgi:hypothetical protein